LRRLTRQCRRLTAPAKTTCQAAKPPQLVRGPGARPRTTTTTGRDISVLGIKAIEQMAE